LSCLDDIPHDRETLSQFLSLLIKTEVDTIELSEKTYRLLSPLPDYSYILRLDDTDNASNYRHINNFICHNSQTNASGNEKIQNEIRLNSMLEACAIARGVDDTKVRIEGLDSAMCGNYLLAFALLKKSFAGGIEFCPSNRHYCATALAAEWITSGEGNEVVTSFAGYGGFAPTEEIIMILRTVGLRKPEKTYEFFPEMAELFARITGKKIKKNKPVIGRQIFNVESGVHVDGILKQPQCYEPFPPETVGQKRKIVLGKQSGTASVRAKLSELNMDCAEEQVPQILEKIKSKAMEKNGEVTNAEFAEIVKGLGI
jgi:homocitrate synthase NifV